MSDRRRLWTGVVSTVGGAVVAGAVSFAIPAAGQGPSGRMPRTTAGRPDLKGIWQAINEANFDVEPHVARAAMSMRPGPYAPVPSAEVLALGAAGSVPGSIGVVEGGSIPYKPGALATKAENQQKWLERDPEIKCYLPGVPRATYMPYPFQILQGDASLMFVYEYADAVRNIYLKDPGPAPIDSWMGQSVGRWEGDTLVIDVTALNDRTWFDRAGNYHSDKLHVTERYTPISRDHLEYQARIDDPEVFSQPWVMRLPLYRRVEKNAQLMEFKCVEFVEELLYGKLRRNPLSR